MNMKQAVVTIKYEEEKLNAIKQYMGKRMQTLSLNWTKCWEKCMKNMFPRPWENTSTAGEMFRQPSRKAIKILREALEHLPECLRRMSNGRRVAVGKQGEGKANPPCDRPWADLCPCFTKVDKVTDQHLFCPVWANLEKNNGNRREWQL